MRMVESRKKEMELVGLFMNDIGNFHAYITKFSTLLPLISYTLSKLCFFFFFFVRP